MERKRLRLYTLWSLLAAGLIYALWGFSRLYFQNRAESGLIYASGRIEGTEVTVGTKVAGRVERLWVREAEPSLEFSRKLVQEQIAQAEASLGAATAGLVRAQANLDWWQKESRRMEDLYRQGMVSTQSVDNAKSSLRAALAEVDQLWQEKERAKASLRLAQSARLQIDIKEKEWAAACSVRSQTKEAMEGARMEIKMAEAAAREAQAVLEDCRILAPLSGTVMTKIAEEGEVLTAGRPILTLIDLNDIYLKVYIPQVEVGKIRLGNPARIFLDAYPDRPFEARMTNINQQAEFTPKNVETRQERVNLVFAVKLTADSPQGLLKPGMPADAVIKYRDQASWPKENR
jgi:HlyD family secretion protein